MKEETLRNVLNELKNELKEATDNSKEDLKKEMKKEIGNIHVRLQQIEEENQEVREEIDELREENENLKERIQQLEEYSRRDNVIISGIQKEENEMEEDLVEKVKEIGKSVGIKIEEYDIHACHRLPPNKNEKAPAMILKLNNRNKRSKLIRRSKDAKI